MKKIVLFSFVMLLISGAWLNAQKMEVKSGAIDFLKNQKNLLVKYDYSNMAVGKYDKEADYIDFKVKEGNDAEPGKGDKWKEDWFGKRTTAYEPSFEELFNKGLEKNGLSCSKTASGAEYSLTIHTTFTDVGYFIGISSKPAYINAEITFTKIATNEVVAVITAEKVPGVGGIKESYAKLGKSLASMISKKF
jgi:hypothetical protein